MTALETVIEFIRAASSASRVDDAPIVSITVTEAFAFQMDRDAEASGLLVSATGKLPSAREILGVEIRTQASER